MEPTIFGLHHITAIAANAKRNHDFYTRTLGLRLVKKTVNFDDPGTYHFYYGNEQGDPGTLLTFFPWEGIGQGKNVAGMATGIGYNVPLESLGFWQKRFKDQGVIFQEQTEIFGEQTLGFSDPDGLKLFLIASPAQDDRKSWETEEIKASEGITGFHSVTLTLKKMDETAKILTDIFGYHSAGQEGNHYRFMTDAVSNAAIVDLVIDPKAPSGHNAAGTNHHVAFRVKDEETQMAFREKIMAADLQITPKIDRDYFFSLYFREPGGVLFEIATDNPGFTVDEPLSDLGTSLKLPKQYEPSRSAIEKMLPKIN